MRTRQILTTTAATARATLAGMETSPKLQRAGRRFLLRLIAEHGPADAAEFLRRLADEIEGLPELAGFESPAPPHGTTDGTTSN